MLENWGLTVFGGEKSPSLFGTVTGHDLLGDGSSVVTSMVRRSINGMVITASGSQYILGDVNKAYLEAVPDARKLLLDKLKDMDHKNEDPRLHDWRYVGQGRMVAFN